MSSYDISKTEIIKVDIGLHVESIGVSAFENCSNLIDICFVNIADSSLNSIDNLSFNSCYSLTSITIPKLVTSLGNHTFYGCSNLTDISFYDIASSSLYSIGSYCFEKCNNLTTITIPKSVTSLGEGIFQNTNKLSSIHFEPDINLSTIPLFFCFECSLLTSITIPKSVTTIEETAFAGCYSLSTIIFESPSNLQDICYNAFQNCSNLTTITIPDSVTTIGDSAFQNCSSLTDICFVNIDDSYLETIGMVAFGWAGLESITIPKTVTTIGEQAFINCSSLTDICFYDISNSSLNTIGQWAFMLNYGLTSITIPASVITISNYAFTSCSNLTDISFYDISNSYLETIGQRAFIGSNLTSIIIPKTVTTIGDKAFKNCPNLASITFERQSSGPILGTNVFEDICANVVYNLCFNNIQLVNQFTTISGSFENTCYNQAQQTTHFKLLGNSEALIDISDDLVSTNYTNTPYYISKANILSVDIGMNVTSLGELAFYECINLTTITIPDSVTTISNEVFKNCTNLSSITFEQQFSGPTLGTNVFLDICANVVYNLCFNNIQLVNQFTTISGSFENTCQDVSAQTTHFKLSGNSEALINISGAIMLHFSDSPFDGDITTIEEVVIGTNVTSLGEWALADCVNLTLITIPDSVTNIAEGAIAHTGIISITIPDSVTTIGTEAFIDNTYLVSITIPDSVTTIGHEVFGRCSNLASITFERQSSGPTLETNVFLDICANAVYKLCFNNILLVNQFTTISGSFENTCQDVSAQTTHFKLLGNSEALIDISGALLPTAYDSTSLYKISQANITSVDIGTNVTTIGWAAFQSCSNLTTITIPDSVTTIDTAAFYECINLTTITIPDSVTTIGTTAFYECINLTTITIPASVTTIGNEVFKNCSNLASVIIEPNSSLNSIGISCFEDSNLTTITYETITYYTNKNFAVAFSPGTIETDAFFNTPFSTEEFNSNDFSSNIFNDTSTNDIIAPYSLISYPFRIFEPSENRMNGSTAVYNFNPGVESDISNIYQLKVSGNLYTSPPTGDLGGTTITLDCLINNASNVRLQYDVVSYDNDWVGFTYNNSDILYDFIRLSPQKNRIEYGNSSQDQSVYTISNETFSGSINDIGSSSLVKRYRMNWSYKQIPDTITLDIYMGTNNNIDGTDYNSYTYFSHTFSNTVSNMGRGIFDNKIGIYVTGMSKVYFRNIFVYGVFHTPHITTIFTNMSGQNVFTTNTTINASDYLTDFSAADISRVQIAPTVTTLGNTFLDCSNLTDISFYDIANSSLTSIGDNCFRRCYNLTSISIPKLVTTLNDNLFHDCYSLTSVSFDDIENSVVSSIGNKCFRYNTSLLSIIIPRSVTILNNSAIRGCDLLTDVTFYDIANSSLQTMDDRCLGNNPLLTSIAIPTSVTSIGDNAFGWDIALTSVIYDNITYYDKVNFVAAFTGDISDNAFDNTIFDTA